MSILAQAKERLTKTMAPRHVDRVMAFTAGYVGDSLPVGQEGDAELRRDWEQGVKAHAKEVSEEEERRVRH